MHQRDGLRHASPPGRRGHLIRSSKRNCQIGDDIFTGRNLSGDSMVRHVGCQDRAHPQTKAGHCGRRCVKPRGNRAGPQPLVPLGLLQARQRQNMTICRTDRNHKVTELFPYG